MPAIQNQLAAVLSTVRTPGDFCVAGRIDLHLPQLQVDGVGPIALPVLPAQAEQLIAVADQAPYGRGAETLIDTEVRRTWQIGADRVQIGGRHWPTTLEAIVARVCVGLGVTSSVQAELYKLLVYDQGSFFVSHRDSEKTSAMFATLIIALPSLHSGGELLVRHKERELRLDLSSSDPSELAYAAFYADCLHEVLPVSSGCRVALVYNLLRKGRGQAPQPPSYDTETAGLTRLLRGWSQARATTAKAGVDQGAAQQTAATDQAPDKLIYPLEHAYTEAEISFQALKGADAAAAAVLAAAAPAAGCDLHVALLRIEESGSAEYTGYSGSRGRGRFGSRGRDDDDDEDDDDEDGSNFDIGEIIERSLTLSHWRRPDGMPAAFGDFPFKDDDICPSDALETMDPDEQHFQEATGNEGASFDRSYQRAALVLWPKQQRLRVLSQAGLAVTLPYLTDLAERWTRGQSRSRDALWHEAHELAGQMLRGWPQHSHHPSDKISQPAQMLALLARLNDTEHIEAFITEVSAAGKYARVDNTSMLQALQQLSAARAGELLKAVLQANADLCIGGCADLLGCACGIKAMDGQLHSAALALVNALPGNPARPPAPNDAWRRESADAAMLADLMRALWRIDSGLAEQAVSHWLAWPKTYGLDEVIVPALRRLADAPALRQQAAGQRLRAAGLHHLQARVALHLGPPGDWQREAALSCRCAHCDGLRQFLLSPSQPTWQFKAKEADRSHAMNSIQQGRCDVDCTVERKGSPHALVCTKNQASYERRVVQRRSDLDDLALLTQLDIA